MCVHNGVKLGKLIRFQISVVTIESPERKPSKCCILAWSQLNRAREWGLGDLMGSEDPKKGVSQEGCEMLEQEAKNVIIEDLRRV